MTMKVILYLTHAGLKKYQTTNLPVEAASKEGGRGRDFIHEVHVGVKEVSFPDGLSVGYVHIQRPKEFGNLGEQIINEHNRLQADVL
jgi:hypothetical protein